MIRPGRGSKRPPKTALKAPEANPAGEGVTDEPPSKKRKLTEEEMKEREARTLFVGNVPLEWTEKKLRSTIRQALGKSYEGSLKPIRFRSIPLEEKWSKSSQMRKAGRILGKYAHGMDFKNAYVVLDAPQSVPVVAKAVNNLEADSEHILRADGVGESAALKKFDRTGAKRSVFLGGLPKRVTESDLRWVLYDAGEVDAVRIVRDKVSQDCKGFAFARFQDRKSVKDGMSRDVALNLWGLKIHGKEIRIMKVEDQGETAEKPSVGSGEAWSRPEDPKNSKDPKRMMQKQQRRQRAKAKKQRDFVQNAKAAGLRTSKKKTPMKKGKRKVKKQSKG
eukprot:g33423.t1